MTGDVGEGLLDDPVERAAHRGRHVVLPTLSLDRQCCPDTGLACPFHQFGDVVESVGWGGVVVAQGLQGGAELPGRLPAGLPDGQQGLRDLFAALAGHMDGGFGLHLDDRDLVRERIVQLSRNVQPLLVSAAPCGLLPGAFGFVGPPLGLPERFTGGACGDQPGDLECAPGLRECLAGVVQARGQGRDGQRGQHGHAHRHRDDAVSRPHGRVHREEERDGSHIEPCRLVPHRAEPGDGEDGNRSPAARGQRQAADCQQHVAEQAEAGGGVLPGQPGDQQRSRHTDGDEPVPDTGPNAEPSITHARTVAGGCRGRIPPADERPTTTHAVDPQDLPRPW